MTDNTLVNARAQNDGEDIIFGKSGGIDWARHSDVIYHEFTHNVIYAIYGDYPTGTPFGAAMLEGVADYFACSTNNESTYAETTNSNRELNNNLVWVDGQSEWRNGQVIGGACWDMRELVGKTIADNLVYRTMNLSPHPLSESQFILNLKKADMIYFNSSNQDAIIEAFDNNHSMEVPIPDVPSISLSGAWGQPPVISWSEVRAHHFRLKKEYKFSGVNNWSSIYVDPAYSPYTDLNIVRNKQGADEARYSIEAIDDYGYKSGFSNYVSTTGNTTWKTVEDSRKDDEELGTEYKLFSNYPNPFNPSTVIKYSMSGDANVSLNIYNSTGELVKTLINEYQAKGIHTIKVDLSNLPSGIYFYSILTDNYSETKKMIYLK